MYSLSRVCRHTRIMVSLYILNQQKLYSAWLGNNSKNLIDKLLFIFSMMNFFSIIFSDMNIIIVLKKYIC